MQANTALTQGKNIDFNEAVQSIKKSLFLKPVSNNNKISEFNLPFSATS